MMVYMGRDKRRGGLGDMLILGVVELADSCDGLNLIWEKDGENMYVCGSENGWNIRILILIACIHT